MFFEGGKMNQIAIQGEGRYAIPDLFLRVWRRCSNRSPYLFKNHSNVFGEAGDIPVDIIGCDSFSFHYGSLF
jgi:hypothetical protein